MIKCELLVGGYAYDVTDNLVNWDDVEMSWKRQELDGVVRSFTTKFEFCKGGYSLLVGEYLRNYLHASASVVFYVRNNSWLWNEKFRCALDFSTFTFNGVTCEINAIDDSLAALIKAKKGTQYEYSVDVIKESTVLRYDRLKMNNKAEWTFAQDEENRLFETTSKASLFVPLYLTSAEIANYNTVDFGDSSFGGSEGVAYDNLPYIISNISGKYGYNVHFSTEFDVWSKATQYCKFKLLGYFPENDSPTVYWESSVLETDSGKKERVKIDIVIPLAINAKVVFVIEDPYYQNSFPAKFIEVHKMPVATFVSRGEIIDIPVVSPAKLLNRLLKSMNEGCDGLTGTIDSDARLDNTVLVAAESIRGIENAKLYTSFNKFKEWMSSEFGFVPVIGEDSVSFVHRDSLFSSKKIKVLEDVTDFELSVDAGKIYSRVNVGYDKVDYESVNGKDEFRFTQQYTTGVDLSDSSLDLKSPYRADAYGIEFLAAKRGEDTTDSESDNDVFMVGVTLADGVYTVDRSLTISGVISPESMFNVMYSQRDMIDANMGYLSSFSNLIEYASSDGNSEVIIDGEGLKDDIELSNRLFTVGVMSVTTEDTDIPTDLSGVVEFDKNGKIYKGYVSEITLNIGRTESVTYKLIVKSVV